MERASAADPDERDDVFLNVVQSIREGDHQSDGESHAVKQQNVELVRQILEELHERDREVLIRFYVREQTVEQICRELGITPHQLNLIRTNAKKRFSELSRLRVAAGAGQSTTAQDGAGSSTNEAVLAHALDTFGSQEKANHWLHRPNHIFHGRTPLETLESDPKAVEIELTRIDHGVYI